MYYLDSSKNLFFLTNKKIIIIKIKKEKRKNEKMEMS